MLVGMYFSHCIGFVYNIFMVWNITLCSVYMHYVMIDVGYHSRYWVMFIMWDIVQSTGFTFDMLWCGGISLNVLGFMLYMFMMLDIVQCDMFP